MEPTGLPPTVPPNPPCSAVACPGAIPGVTELEDTALTLPATPLTSQRHVPGPRRRSALSHQSPVRMQALPQAGMRCPDPIPVNPPHLGRGPQHRGGCNPALAPSPTQLPACTRAARRCALRAGGYTALLAPTGPKSIAAQLLAWGGGSRRVMARPPAPLGSPGGAARPPSHSPAQGRPVFFP